MKIKKAKRVLTFKDAVELTPDISTGYKKGLSALGNNSNCVSVSDTSKLQGSIDIDAFTKLKYPRDNRWDYAFAYKGEVFFVEVHSANSSQVSTLVEKLLWLKNWLVDNAPEINKIKAKSRNPFIWIQTKNVHIPKHTPQYRMAIQYGLSPLRKLELN